MGMGWIQCHKRHGALLALAALVLQIVLSFGHVHLHGMAQSAPAAITHPIALADKNSQTPAPIPADNDDYCAVCASIFLASSAFTPAPPMLPMPIGFHRVEYSIYHARSLGPSQRLAFQARAPPEA
jgi:hypothetical protein